MSGEQLRKQAIDLYDRFTHDGMERREFFAAMTRLAGGAAAATALIGSIAASSAAASLVAANDRRLRTGTIRLDGGGAAYKAYFAEPRGRGAKLGTVMVIHENRGLNEHIRDVARRLGLTGFRAVAPDFLSPSGGTPVDEDAARAAIGKLDLGAATTAAVAMVDRLRSAKGGNGRVGVVGFCWGGAFVNRLAVAAGPKLGAGVAYYGTGPDPAEARRVSAPLLIHCAGLDARVNQTAFPWVKALRAAGRPVEFRLYEGVNHAFNNDTSAERFDKHAAELAWGRTVRFLRRNLH